MSELEEEETKGDLEQIVKDFKALVLKFKGMKCNDKCKECPLREKVSRYEDICNVLIRSSTATEVRP